MFELPLPSPVDGVRVVSFDRSASDQVVFGYFPDGIGHATSEYYFRDGERALEPGVSTLNA